MKTLTKVLVAALMGLALVLAPLAAASPATAATTTSKTFKIASTQKWTLVPSQRDKFGNFNPKSIGISGPLIVKFPFDTSKKPVVKKTSAKVSK